MYLTKEQISKAEEVLEAYGVGAPSVSSCLQSMFEAMGIDFEGLGDPHQALQAEDMTEPDKLIGAFYLDCFTEGNLPVNSYGPASFARCLKEAGKLRAISGVTRITIAPETLGQCPMPIGDSYKHQDPG